MQCVNQNLISSQQGCGKSPKTSNVTNWCVAGKLAAANGRATPPAPKPAPAPAPRKAAPDDEFLAEVQMSAGFEARFPALWQLPLGPSSPDTSAFLPR